MAWDVMHPTRNSYASRMVGAAGHFARRFTDSPLDGDDPAWLMVQLKIQHNAVIKLEINILCLIQDTPILQTYSVSILDSPVCIDPIMLSSWTRMHIFATQRSR